MVKKIYPEKYVGSGYSVWSVRRTLSEAVNVARWSPWHAHAWMEEARDQLCLEKPFYSEFNEAASKINAYWLMMSKFYWYDQVGFWKFENQPRPVTLIELI